MNLIHIQQIEGRAGAHDVADRIHGSDFMALLVQGLPEARHFFFGSTPETLGLLEASLRRRFPSIRIAGMVSPPFRKRAQKEDDATLEAINRSQADIPANSGAGPRSPSRSAWAPLQGHALATTPSAMAVARALRRVAKGCVILLPAFQFKRSSVRELAATQMLRPNL